MGGCLHHPPGIAGGTNTTPFTGERDEEIVTATGTSGSSKTIGQNATRQILAKILFDVSSNRQTLPIRLPATGQPGFQMTLHHLINRAALRLSAPINCSAWSAFNRALATGCRYHDPARE
jgi:hypothetical protein